MALLHAHRGPISGLTHIHVLRESAAVRAGRMADAQPVPAPDPGRAFTAELPPDGRLGADRRPAMSRGQEPAETL
jgi:hypothetical protein